MFLLRNALTVSEGTISSVMGFATKSALRDISWIELEALASDATMIALAAAE